MRRSRVVSGLQDALGWPQDLSLATPHCGSGYALSAVMSVPHGGQRPERWVRRPVGHGTRWSDPESCLAGEVHPAPSVIAVSST